MKKNISFIIISVLIIIDSYFYKIKKYCLKCIKDFNYDSKCRQCPIDIIFKGFKIISAEDTLNEIIYHKKSISRFGDGEFHLIFGKSISFQEYNKILSKRLIQVLTSNEKSLMIGINIPFKRFIENYTDNQKKAWIKWLEKHKFKIAKLLNKKKKYYSANISRFFLIYKDKSFIPKYIKKLRKIWDKKDVLIIEGKNTKFGMKNDLLNNAKSIKRILCPSNNAFNFYNQILNKVANVNKNILILIALGPTATILSYDLYKLGYQAIDIGHMDFEYRCFLNYQKSINKK